MIVRIGKRARREAERIDAQWREVADFRHLFAAEFEEMLELLETTPGLGQPWPTAKRPNLKRVLLRKTQVHLYFERHAEEIRILCVWWGRRKRPPKL